MYKFRTLVPDADSITKGNPLEMVAMRHKLVTPAGKFLRTSRLDELPQLFNILKGDMDFIGPRPQPADFYEKFWKNVKDYDKRFSVKPGLIGYPQLFLPHFAPKRIQGLIDNKFIQNKQRFLLDTYFIIITIVIVIIRVFNMMSRIIWHDIIQSKILGKYQEKRVLERIRTKEAWIYITAELEDNSIFRDKNRPVAIINEANIFTDSARLIDINEQALLVYADDKIKQENFIFRMEIEHKSFYRNKRKKKRAYCYGKMFRSDEMRDNHHSYKYIIKYDPISPLNYYMVHQYFLRESLIE